MSQMQKSFDEESLAVELNLKEKKEEVVLKVEVKPVAEAVVLKISKEIESPVKEEEEAKQTTPPAEPPQTTAPQQIVSEIELRLQLENMELHQLHSKLQDRIEQERKMSAKFRAQIESYKGFVDSDSGESSGASTPAYLSPETEARLEQLIEENHQLNVSIFGFFFSPID